MTRSVCHMMTLSYSDTQIYIHLTDPQTDTHLKNMIDDILVEILKVGHCDNLFYSDCHKPCSKTQSYVVYIKYYSPGFGLLSVAILPWLCRKRLKSIFIYIYIHNVLEVVDRVSETQLGQNFNWIIWRLGSVQSGFIDMGLLKHWEWD